MSKKTKRNWWIAIAALAVLATVALLLGYTRPTPVQHFSAKVEQGDIKDVVEATGTINAVVTVQVGSQVSGTISKLNADFNSRVHKGDVVALIDPALFRGALQQAQADLENAKANLEAAVANLERSKASSVQTKADFDRAVGLARSGVVSQQQLDQAKANYDSAIAAENAAAANITQAKAQVTQKQAAVKVAETNLEYTVIRSPIDGTVVARNVDVGQTVAASLQAPTIFTIAQDLTKMWLYAKTDESDVATIRVGKPVTFKVDALPKDTFNGVVKQVRLNPTTVQSVVTYDTIIEFANPDLKLFPGMTAYVTIPVASVQDVLKVPNTALRYKAPLEVDEIKALYKRYGIEPSTPSQDSDSKKAKNTVAIIWKLHPDNTLEPVQLSLGITDHEFTQVLAVTKGQLNKGDDVVIRSLKSDTPAPGTIRR